MYRGGKVHGFRRGAPVDGNTQIGGGRPLLPVGMEAGLDGNGQGGGDRGHQ